MLKHRIIADRLECGTDEAGRGCLAGPVTAAAVILDSDFSHEWLNDSKQLSQKKREVLRQVIEDNAMAYGVAHVLPEEIDELNILNASILAMHKAIDKLSYQPEFILVDGNRFKPYMSIKHECFVKGDARYMNIAAASVLAKTYRDDIMVELHKKHIAYDWHKNKGYPTRNHRKAIERYGATNYHRKSFKLLPDQLRIEF